MNWKSFDLKYDKQEIWHLKDCPTCFFVTSLHKTGHFKSRELGRELLILNRRKTNKKFISVL